MHKRKLDTLRRVAMPNSIFKKGEEVQITIEYGDIYIQKFYPERISEEPYTGVVRKIDLLGRITIPAEYLHTLGIEVNSEIRIEIFEAEKKIRITVSEKI